MIPTEKHHRFDPTNDSIEELVDEIVQAPTVAFFVDLENFKRVLQTKDYAEKLADFGNRLGRLNQFHVFDHDRQSLHEKRDWRKRGAVVHTIRNGSSKDAIFSMEVMKVVNSGSSSMFVFAVTDNRYQNLARYIAESGAVVTLVAPQKSNTTFIQNYCYFSIDLEDLIGRVEKPVDIDSYDFTDFVELLDSTESNLPFVGVKYFIEKQMEQLGISNMRIRHKIMERARDEDIVAFGSIENIHGRKKPVTTCTLNKKNDLVQEILGIEIYDEDEEGSRSLTVTKDELTLTEHGGKTETTTFASGDFSDIEADEKTDPAFS
jgi:hypothetical protein